METSVVVVRADSPYKTMKDLVDAAKAKPNLRASTNGMKASNHTAAQLLAQSAGFKYKAIPYGGTADQLLALRQGEVQFSCAKVADIAKLASGDKPDENIEAAIALVQGADRDVTGMVLAPAFKSALAKQTTADGAKLYPQLALSLIHI